MEAKMQISERLAELMPSGQPDMKAITRHVPMEDLIAENGRKVMLSVLIVLVSDFCNSLNVKRPMTEDQIFEAADALLDECSGFRLEDYVCMFHMAKRGKLVGELYSSMDVRTIAAIRDAYERQTAKELAELEAQEYANEQGRRQQQLRQQQLRQQSKRPLYCARWVIGYEKPEGLRYHYSRAQDWRKGAERRIIDAIAMLDQERERQKKEKEAELHRRRIEWGSKRLEMLQRFYEKYPEHRPGNSTSETPENTKTI